MRRATIPALVLASLGCFTWGITGETQYDYLLLKVAEAPTLQKELDEAAAQGFRFGVMNSSGIIMQRERDREGEDRFQYQVLGTRRVSTMQKEMSQFGTEGFRYRGLSYFHGRKVVILERDPSRQPGRYEYKLLETKKISSMQKELNHAAVVGFELVAMAGDDGNRLMSILQRRGDRVKAAGEREQYDYLVLETTETLPSVHTKSGDGAEDVDVAGSDYSSLQEVLDKAATHGFQLATVTTRSDSGVGFGSLFAAEFLNSIGDAVGGPVSISATPKKSDVLKTVFGMKKKRGREGEGRFRHRILKSFPTSWSPTSWLHYGGQPFFGEKLVIVERDPNRRPISYEYRQVASDETSTMQKDLKLAGDAGFELVGMSGRRKPVVTLRKKKEAFPQPAEKAAGDGSGIYRYGSGITNPVPIIQSTPSYTDAARRAKVQGVVWIQVIIRKDGRPDDFKVIQGLGHGLDEQAIREIQTNWRFRPGLFDGKPVDVLVTIAFQFNLEK